MKAGVCLVAFCDLVLRFVNTVTYFFGRSSGGETIGFLLELGKQAVKIVAGEGPLEGLGGFLIALLEADDLTFESGRRGEVVGIEDLALDN